MKQAPSKVLVERGIDAFEKSHFKRAIRIFKEVLAIDSKAIDAHFYLVLCYRKLGQFAQAMGHARKVLEINPSEPNARLNLGVVQADLGSESSAIRNYNRELRRNPGCFEAHYNLGRVCIRRGRWKQAFNHLFVCWTNNHQGKLRDEYLAMAAQHVGNTEIEERIYKSRLDLEPNNKWALNNLGVLRNIQGRSKEAKSLFEKILVLYPSDKRAKHNLRYTLNLLSRSVESPQDSKPTPPPARTKPSHGTMKTASSKSSNNPATRNGT